MHHNLTQLRKKQLSNRFDNRTPFSGIQRTSIASNHRSRVWPPVGSTLGVLAIEDVYFKDTFQHSVQNNNPLETIAPRTDL